MTVQISIYAFIILHSIAWHVFGFHFLTKLCPGKFALHIGNLEFNFNVVFWGLVFLSTLFVGRAFCSWGCMFGAYQDMVARVLDRFKIRRIKGKTGAWIAGILIVISGLPFLFEGTPPWPAMFWFLAMVIIVGITAWWIVERKSSKRQINTVPRYILLAHFLGGIVASWILLNVFQKGFSLAFDKYGVLDDYLSPAGVAAVIMAFGLAALGVAVEKRFFCKHICPYGLLLRFMSALPFTKRRKVRATGAPCSRCGGCNKVCPMGVDLSNEITTYGMVKDPECINCLRCVAKCPKNTLDFTGELS